MDQPLEFQKFDHLLAWRLVSLISFNAFVLVTDCLDRHFTSFRFEMDIENAWIQFRNFI